MTFTFFSGVEQWEAAQLAEITAAIHKRLLHTVKNVITSITSPDEAAKRIEAFSDDLVLNRLAALIAALSRLPDAVNNTDSPLAWEDDEVEAHVTASGEVIAADGARLWASLPYMGWKLRDLFKEPYSQDQGASEHDARKQWSSLNAFIAHLTKLSSQPGDSLDYYIYAIWCLRDALEEEDTDPNIQIQAAAQWIRIVGPELRSGGRPIPEEEKVMARGGSLYNSEAHGSGFTPQRWAFWRDTFRHFAQAEDVDAELRELAAQTASTME